MLNKNFRPITRWKECVTIISCLVLLPTSCQLLPLLKHWTYIVLFGPVPGKQHDRPHYWRRQNMENHPWLLPLKSLTKAFRHTKFTSLTSFYGIHLFPFPRLPLKFRPPQCTRPLEVIFYLVSSIHTSLPTLYTGQLFFNSNLSLWILCLKLFHKDAQHHSLSEKCKSKPQWGTITHQSGWLLSKSLQAINAGEGVEKRDPSYTVGGNAN